MLTGDKVETARSIGKSCGLIRYGVEEMLIQAELEVDLHTQLNHFIELRRQAHQHFEYYIIVTGDTLLHMAHSSRAADLRKKVLS